MAKKRGGFARHPRCGERNCPRLDRADEVSPGETVQFRGYHCPKCSEAEGRPWFFWTAERIYRDGATSPYLRRMKAEDFEPDFTGDAPPACEAPSGGDSQGGGCTSGPREAPEALPGEMRGIRRTA